MSTSNYSPDQIDVVIAGVRMSGFAPGSFVSVSLRTDSDTLTVGADGLAAFNRNLDNSATVTITLMPNSVSNDVLTGFWQAQLAGVVHPFAMQDRSGRTVAAGAACRIAKLPDVSYGTEVEPRAWTIIVSNLNLYVGGSPAAPTSA
jgi:hypothetical protein